MLDAVGTNDTCFLALCCATAAASAAFLEEGFPGFCFLDCCFLDAVSAAPCALLAALLASAFSLACFTACATRTPSFTRKPSHDRCLQITQTKALLAAHL